MSNDSEPFLISVQGTTSRYSPFKAADVASAVVYLLSESATQSITITRQALYEDSYVLCVTSAYSAPEAPTSSSARPRTSAIPLPGELWAET